MSAAPAADAVNGILAPPTDAETLTLFQPASPATAEINSHILTHPLAERLRAESGVVESRPHLKIPEAMRPHNLTGGVLLGPGKIEVPPLSLAHQNDPCNPLPIRWTPWSAPKWRNWQTRWTQNPVGHGPVRVRSPPSASVTTSSPRSNGRIDQNGFVQRDDRRELKLDEWANELRS